jgi:acetate---CoA ligase (ADP-forming)
MPFGDEQTMTLDGFLSPGSVAVVGVGRREGGVGRAVFDNLVAGGFPGPVFAINAKASAVGERPSYPDVASLPQTPDLVVIVIPAAEVGDVIDQCGERGVTSVIVISAGFKESGPAGAALERDIVERARRHGIRLLGPNCLGLLAPHSRLNASFAVTMPAPGSVAVFSQSGALGTAMLDRADSTGRGLSAFVSLGNRADVSESDLLEAFRADPATKVVAGYLESVTSGARFVSVASEVTRSMPVVLLKAGGSDAGARAVSSHTGSLAGSDAAYDAAFRAAGIIRVRDIEDLFGLSEAFALQPVPDGPGVAILTNAGGPAVMATDACEREGVTLASLERATVDALRAALPAAAAVYNPVDVLGDADDARFGEAARILAADPGVRALLVVLTPQTPTRPVETARAIAGVASASGVTVLACFMGERSVAGGRVELLARGIPAYPYPERAVAALAGMERYRAIRARPRVAAPPVEADRDRVAAVLAEARAARTAFVTEERAAQVAEAYGIATPKAVLARDLAEAREAAREIGYPVALKIASPDILHKSDIGGISLGIAGPEDLARAWEAILDSAHRRMPDALVWGAVVQEMAPPGREVIVGVDRDPTFGPLLMFGLGGVYVEVMKDVTFSLCPVTKRDALEMISSVRAYGLLRGARGQEAADLDAVADVLVRVSALATDFPEIVELDINPLIVAKRGGGALAADIRIGIGG